MTLKSKIIFFTILALAVLCASALLFQEYRYTGKRFITIISVLDEIRFATSAINKELRQARPDPSVIQGITAKIPELSRRLMEIGEKASKPATFIEVELSFVRVHRMLREFLPGQDIPLPLQGQIYNEIDKIEGAIGNLRTLFRQNIERMQRRAEIFIELFFWGLCFYLFGVIYFLIRIIIGPILLLSGQIKAVREGERDNVELLPRKDEIGLLGEFIFNTIAELMSSNTELKKEISERKQAEEKFKQSASTLENVLNNSNPICITNTKFEVLLANKAYYEVWPQSDTTSDQGMYCYASRPGSHCHTENCPLLQIMHGKESVQVVASKTREKGQVSDFIITARPFRNEAGDLIGIVENFQDISEQRRVEAALESERERLSVTLKSIGDGVITTDTSGKIVLINEVAEKLTGWSHSEAIGRPLPEVFHIIHEKNGERQDDPVARVIRSGRILGLSNDTLLIAKDGTQYAIADTGAPIMAKDKQIVGVVLVFRDVTEEKRMEQELQKVAKLESIGVLAGGIAHDFNNILSAILGNLSLASHLVNPEDQVYQLLIEAEKASYRAKDLTLQLLTFSKGGAPVKKLASVPEIIRESADFILRGSRVRCEYNFADDLWPVEIDTGQVSQVIQNIILNAGNAMAAGGLVHIECRNFVNNRKEAVPVEADRLVAISIRDRGAGIPPEMLEKIFDPYFTTKGEGAGLGLTICHSIITKHGGHIRVRSAVGVGSTFTIYLPASEKKLHRDAREDNDRLAPQEQRGTIMIMDDEEALRRVAEGILSFHGYDVVHAANGEEAIALYQQLDGARTIALIIMDITIPGGMGGKEAAQKILAINPQAKMIVSSGYSNDPIMADCQKFGFRAAITKPFRMSEFIEVIDGVLQ